MEPNNAPLEAKKKAGLPGKKNFVSNMFSWLWFWLWSWPLLPNKKEAEVLKDLQDENSDETKNWIYISVLLNLFPFVFSLAIEYFNNNQNLLCLVNNGSLPILAYSLLATNFFYLLENVPSFDNSKSFQNIKTRLYVLAVLTMFISAVLYVFQSNLINGFHNNHLRISAGVSTLMLIMAIAWGSKMYLLQQKKIADYAEGVNEERRRLITQNDGDGYEQ